MDMRCKRRHRMVSAREMTMTIDMDGAEPSPRVGQQRTHVSLAKRNEMAVNRRPKLDVRLPLSATRGDLVRTARKQQGSRPVAVAMF